MWIDDQEGCELDNTKDCFHTCQGCKLGIWKCPICKEVIVYPEKCSCSLKEKENYYD